MIWYICILLFFLLLEGTIIVSVNIGFKKLEKRRLVNLYLLVRAAKIALSIIFVGVYYFVVKTDIKTFAVVFLLFYLLSVGFETWYFISKERQLKKEEGKE